MEGLPWLFFVVVSELLNISFSPTPCFNQRNPLDCRLVNQRKIFPAKPDLNSQGVRKGEVGKVRESEVRVISLTEE